MTPMLQGHTSEAVIDLAGPTMLGVRCGRCGCRQRAEDCQCSCHAYWCDCHGLRTVACEARR